MFCAFNCFYCKHKNGSIEIRNFAAFFQHAKNGITHTDTHTASERAVDKREWEIYHHRRSLVPDTMSLFSQRERNTYVCVCVCVRESRVTVFGEVYDAKLAFLFTQSQDQLFSVAILKFFFFLSFFAKFIFVINVEWARMRRAWHECGFHMHPMGESKIRMLIFSGIWDKGVNMTHPT